LQQTLGDDWVVHTTDQIYRSAHIDTTVLALDSATVLLNGSRVGPHNCPPLLDGYLKLYFSDIVPTPSGTIEFHEKVRKPVHAELARLGFESSVEFLCSDWIGMNVLSIDPETVIVDKRQLPLIRFLEANRYTVVPISFRHSYLLGGIHCATLDTVRDE